MSPWSRMSAKARLTGALFSRAWPVLQRGEPAPEIVLGLGDWQECEQRSASREADLFLLAGRELAEFSREMPNFVSERLSGS